MKCFATILAVALVATSSPNACAFSGSSFTGSQLKTDARNSGIITMEYIPEGMTKEQWRKLKEEEKKKTQGKNLGTVGITSFKSRTFADWQKSGGKNLFPVDPKKVKDPKEIPYMQRPGGKADDSDLNDKKKGGGMFGGMFGGKK